jgi:isocitrate dehydrogenase
MPATTSASITSQNAPAKKELVGTDVFVEWHGKDPAELAAAMSKLNGEGLELTMITSRGVKVWPGGLPETFLIDHWRCRFSGSQVSHTQLVNLLNRVAGAGFDFIKTENLYTFDGKPSYSHSQG